jgi:hypothetical protein
MEMISSIYMLMFLLVSFKNKKVLIPSTVFTSQWRNQNTCKKKQLFKHFLPYLTVSKAVLFGVDENTVDFLLTMKINTQNLAGLMIHVNWI